MNVSAPVTSVIENNTYRRQRRADLADLLRGELIGPSAGPEEVLPERPDKRYLMGMLFPKNAVAAQVVTEEETAAGEAGELETDPDTAEDGGLDSPTDLMFQRLPASVGVSFAVQSNAAFELEAWVSAAVYEPSEAGRRGRPGKWRRRPLPGGDAAYERVSLSVSGEGVQQPLVLGGRARLHVAVREGPQASWIVTASLINEAEVAPGESKYDPADCLYQVGLDLRPSAQVRPWPSPDRLSPDLEDEELALQYRMRPALAVGHGCAADWQREVDGRFAARVEFLPQVEVPPITADIRDLPAAAADVLSLQRLQSAAVSDSDLLAGLTAFASAYEAWRASLDTVDVPAEYELARARILARIDAACGRIRSGIELLRTDAGALRCFRLANRAMLLQMIYAARVKATERGGESDPSPAAPDAPEHAARRWRPFQLAFLLQSLRGLWDAAADDRDVVDLIWFPTGGGKTEAYLAVAAFEMIRRRLVDSLQGGGTAVLMRYTLRLLTQQQFQRSGHLICALETLRKSAPSLLGAEPFSLGLWVGNKVTPGTLAAAFTDYDAKLRQHIGKVVNPFTLLRCPSCGYQIVPDEFDELGAPGAGIRCSTTEFAFHCPDSACAFHDVIPVQIVDQLLYRHPPTMLLATLDKFAMMAWNDDAARFLGARRPKEPPVEPPSLIIQDELHLISGPLGTIAGGYEAALETAIEARGRRPKIIASTATTRRVDEQGRGLYARPVQVFPPPGLDAGESFFASAMASEAPGRLYIGAMAQGHTPTFSNVLASAALLTAIPRLKLPPQEEDGWWTLVAYHNSRRELGRSLTLARDDIPSRISALSAGKEPMRRVSVVEELSANIKGDQIPNVLEALSRPKTAGEAVDYLGCTNMLSVGIDVDRLGLMLMLGQPKTASEYIQATSRVGRSERYLPGVVLTLYMPTKPRDRSHYELFRPFHEALYRYVEPSSVTPYALPARQRVFHAALIAAVRMATGLAANREAANFTATDPEVRAVADRLYERMRAADASEAAGIAAAAEEIETWWTGMATAGLRYTTAANATNYRALIKRYGEVAQSDARETLQSMRHVDMNVRVRIKGQSTGPVGQGGQ